MTTKKDKKGRKLHIKLIVIMAIITTIAFVCKQILNNETSYAISQEVQYTNEVNKQYEKKEQNINLEQIIEQNRNKQEEKIEVTEIDLEYATNYQNSSELPKGTLQVLQEGKIGKQNQIVRKVFENGELIKEETMGTKVVIASIDKIILVGTGDYKSNYKIKVGDILYVTSNTLDVRQEPKIDATRVIVLNKNDSVKVLNISQEWYEISYGNYSGWVKKDCVTYINPNNVEQENSNSGGNLTKTQLLAKLNKNMKLNTPSGFSMEQFKKVLSNNAKDKNKIIQNNAEYFYYAEKQYKVNGIFLASVAIHESNWGTSKLATTKNNLFGYGAYDRNPYESAYSFSNHAEGIDLLGRVFMKYYLNPSGTKIYENEVAVGSHYNGTTLEAVNKKYATDSRWADCVYTWMEYLYKRL